MKKNKGFTLIEVMIVVAIIVILAATIIPNIIVYVNRAKYAPKQVEVITQKQEMESLNKTPAEQPHKVKEGDEKKL